MSRTDFLILNCFSEQEFLSLDEIVRKTGIHLPLCRLRCDALRKMGFVRIHKTPDEHIYIVAISADGKAALAALN
ncbi:winged helix-turn-helix domain-containing protein [Nibrella saemangeumensis]|uniref:winged helix-turn-helix domain-containing protein n=1 Tax=Nibrella saemangeumensis TaxID=1084526 RepID=UPI003CD0BE36